MNRRNKIAKRAEKQKKLAKYKEERENRILVWKAIQSLPMRIDTSEVKTSDIRAARNYITVAVLSYFPPICELSLMHKQLDDEKREALRHGNPDTKRDCDMLYSLLWLAVNSINPVDNRYRWVVTLSRSQVCIAVKPIQSHSTPNGRLTVVGSHAGKAVTLATHALDRITERAGNCRNGIYQFLATCSWELATKKSQTGLVATSNGNVIGLLPFELTTVADEEVYACKTFLEPSMLAGWNATCDLTKTVGGYIPFEACGFITLNFGQPVLTPSGIRILKHGELLEIDVALSEMDELTEDLE